MVNIPYRGLLGPPLKLFVGSASAPNCLSYREARRALSECRASCREHYRGLHPMDLPEMIKLYGGLEVIVNMVYVVL